MSISHSKSKVIREVTPLSDRDFFYIADRSKSEFTYPIHSHQEVELNFTEHAAGVRRIVGDSVEIMGDYDLVLIASKNLEHVWEQHECNSERVREITIQFSADLFNNNFVNKGQFDSIREMIEKAQRGLAFPMSAILKVYSRLDKLSGEKDGFTAILTFMSILHDLAECEDAKILSSSSFAKIETYSDSKRVQKVQTYINENYKSDIRLPVLADMVGMSAV
ncbi:MAG: AraC family transcriptional regulator, partial [Bacteroidia bacterium]|nr:AraC family transcriptional regulator [Bacteroidia bacterium]